MRIRSFGAACLVALVALVLVRPSEGRAQGTPPGTAPGTPQGAAKGSGPGTVSGAAEVGGRAFVNPLTDQQLGKFDEYRDLRTGGVLQQLLLGYTPRDSFSVYRLVARDLLQRDQSMWLQAMRPGTFDFNARWDRIPHTFSTDGRSLGTTTAPGVYTLPVPRPDSNAWRAAPYLAPIRTQWDPVKLSLGITPSESWDFKAEYTRIGKLGNRPMGMAFGGSSNPSREILEPIDQTVQDVRVSQGYAAKNRRFQVSASWDVSHFQNAFSSVQSDNPQQAANTAAAGAAVGRTALSPSNSANTGIFTGSLNLPAHTRVVATVSHSWMKQDAPFIANTTNTLLASVTVPRSSLGGDVQTSMMNASLTSRPTQDLSLSARLRSFDYKNNTPPLAMPQLVINDRSLAAGDTSGANPFTKTNADLSANYRLPHSFSLGAGYAQEKWTRDPDRRNVTHTSESTPRVSLDFRGIDWLMLRSSYSKGSRRSDDYHQNNTTENPDFRRFDQADRDRERVSLLLVATPMEQSAPLNQMSFTLDWTIGHDGYPNSPFGVQSDNSAMTSAAVDWAPSARFSVGAGFVREDFANLLHQRYRSGTQLANPTFDWVDRNTDRINTAFASFTANLIEDKLDVGGNFSLSDAMFHVYTVNPLPPSGTGATASNLLQATAADWPKVTQRSLPLTAFVRYLYNPDWAMTLRYQVETYNQNDFRTQNPSYVAPGVLSPQIGNYYFEGNSYQNYYAGWVTLVITWKPGALPFARGRSTL